MDAGGEDETTEYRERVLLLLEEISDKLGEVIDAVTGLYPDSPTPKRRKRLKSRRSA